MKKVLLVTLACFFLFTDEADASLVSISKEGAVSINVLSLEDGVVDLSNDSDLEVKQVANEGVEENSVVSVEKNDGKISLLVGTNRQFDVTGWEDSLVEIEERPKTKKIKLSLDDQDFLITQDRFSVRTGFPVSIDPLDNRFFVRTDQGKLALAQLPDDVAQSILKTKLISRIKPEPFELIADDGSLSYLVRGDKVIELLSIYDFKIPVITKVSAQTGSLSSIESPNWLRFLSILFI